MSKTNRLVLTLKRIKEFECPADKQQAFMWDTDPASLAVRATSAGAKSYIFESKLHGKTVRITIGSPQAWTIPDARAEARRLQTLIDAGTDPRQEKADKREAHEAARVESQRQRMTLAEAWPVYIEARRAKWGERHLRDHQDLARLGGEPKKRGKGLTEPGPLAALLPAKLSDLTPARLKSWLEAESASRPTQAALAFRCLSVFANWCEERPELAGLVPAGAFKARAAKEAVQPVQKKDGDCLQMEMLPLWFAAVRGLNNPVQATYLQGLLLTGARRRELSGLQWDDVDFLWGSMTLRDKVEGERTIPLTPYLASLLSGLPRRNAFVFSSPAAADGRLQNPDKAYTAALLAADLPHVSLHGLRRSFITLSEWEETPSGVVAQIVGHKSSAVQERHYKRRSLDLLRHWHEKIETWMLEQAGIEFDAKQSSARLRVVA